MTDMSMKHDKHDASKQKAGIAIRIFGVCPISPTNGQKSEGKTRLHRGMLRERMGGGWVKKWTGSVCQSEGMRRREGGTCFFLPFFILHYAQTSDDAWHQNTLEKHQNHPVLTKPGHNFPGQAHKFA
jgi:hypothetical protein